MAMAKYLVLAVIGAVVAAAGSAAPRTGRGAEVAWAIVAQRAKTIQATEHFVIEAPRFTVNRWSLIAGAAPSLPGQKNTTTRLVPGGEPIEDLSSRHRQLLRAVIPVHGAAQQHELRGRVEYQATLYRRNLVRREPGQKYPPAETLAPAERQLSLAQTPTLDFANEKFQRRAAEAAIARQPRETELDFARRAFLAITRTYHYQWADEMDRHCSYVCQHNAADRGGLTALFVGTLRANGMPARQLLAIGPRARWQAGPARPRRA